MDIYKFINSSSIANYLRETKYEFSSLEVAWLIYQSIYVPMDGKLESWKALIEKYPDCEVPKRPNCKHAESLHGFLTEYISIFERKYASFQSDDRKAVLEYRFL